ETDDSQKGQPKRQSVGESGPQAMPWPILTVSGHDAIAAQREDRNYLVAAVQGAWRAAMD
ncbi:hypothetical protein, partial [Kitasatospora sp. NPDC048538]|uniref:hypothetical protein n=1 Tax=unclassified Kitasatospora TaxID=2633591 RepID=UPI0033E3D379